MIKDNSVISLSGISEMVSETKSETISIILLFSAIIKIESLVKSKSIKIINYSLDRKFDYENINYLNPCIGTDILINAPPYNENTLITSNLLPKDHITNKILNFKNISKKTNHNVDFFISGRG